MQFLTIGVYGYSEEEFFEALISNKVDLFLDMRQRRGVRGRQYRFVNSNYLQKRLEELGIDYLYEKDLAPTTEIREAQKIADKQNGTVKSLRTELGTVFKEKYIKEILNSFDFKDFLKKLERKNNIVLFCVEAKPDACHRSLVAEKLQQLEYTTRHITK